MKKLINFLLQIFAKRQLIKASAKSIVEISKSATLHFTSTERQLILSRIALYEAQGLDPTMINELLLKLTDLELEKERIRKS